MTCIQLHKRAERIGCMLMDKAKLNTGDHVALLYPPGLDLVCAFYGCLYAGKYTRVSENMSILVQGRGGGESMGRQVSEASVCSKPSTV